MCSHLPIRYGALAVALVLAACIPARAATVDFEDTHLGGILAAPTPPADYGDFYPPTTTNAYETGSFADEGLTFSYYRGYDSTYGYHFWGGWSFSNMVYPGPTGYDPELQYDAMAPITPGGGVNGSATYGIVYGEADSTESAEVTVDPGVEIQGAWVTNTSFGYDTMDTGNMFALPLGPGDWLNVTIRGYDSSDALVDSVPVYLADFRSGKSDILEDWQYVDLSPLAGSTRLTFTFDEPEHHKSYGFMNHPSFMAIDDITAVVVPEPASLMLLAAAAVGFLWWKRRR